MTTPNYTPEHIGLRVYDAYTGHTMRSARSQQQEERRIGASEIGLCRSYLKHMIVETPYDDSAAEDPKWMAFVGSALGDRIETAYLDSYPNVTIQSDFETEFPSGLTVPGHADIVDVDYNCVIDIKSKDGLTMVKAGGASRSNRYQIASYLLVLIQAGVLKEGARAFLVYLDRSGRDPHPHVVEVVVDDTLIAEIESFMGDAIYAAKYNVEAEWDQEQGFCENYCQFYTSCRGKQTLAEGVIESEEAKVALKVYLEAKDTEKSATGRKKEASEVLKNYSGIVIGDEGPFEVSQTTITGSSYTVDRQPYDRLNVRKKSAAPKKKVS